jgi:predicted HicB family RNase H-like nuclease
VGDEQAPSRGRPKRYDTRTGTAIRFPEELHVRLVAAAAERALSVNWLVCRAVERFLDDLLPLDQIVLTRSQQEVTRG